MNTDMALRIGQCLGTIGGILNILIILSKNRSKFLYAHSLKGFLTITKLCFIGETRVIPIVIVEMIRNFIYAKTKKKWIPVVFIVLMLTLCFVFYSGTKLIFLLIGYTYASIIYFNRDLRKIKLLQVISYVFWFPWDFSVKDYGKICCNIIITCIVFVQNRKAKLSKDESTIMVEEIRS